MSMKAYNPRLASPNTLEIRVFESVFVGNPSKMPLYGEVKPILAPVEAVFARIMEPIRAILYAPRPPSVRGSFVLNPKPMSL